MKRHAIRMALARDRRETSSLDEESCMLENWDGAESCIIVFLARAACSDDAKCIPLHHSPPSKVLRCRWTMASSRLQRLSDRHRLTHLWQQARLHFLSILNLQVSISPVQILKRSRSVTSKGRYHIRFRLCSEANRDYAIRYEAQKS